MSEIDFTPEVLRNKGVPTEFAVVIKGDDDWIKKYDSEGNHEEDIRNIKFTHNVIADLEEGWDGLANWQESLDEKPISTLRKTLSLMFGISVDKVGAMMLEGRLPEYNNAIGVAWAIANGVDPTMAIRLLEQTKIAVDSQIGMINAEMGKVLDEMQKDTLGESQ